MTFYNFYVTTLLGKIVNVCMIFTKKKLSVEHFRYQLPEKPDYQCYRVLYYYPIDCSSIPCKIGSGIQLLPVRLRLKPNIGSWK